MLARLEVINETSQRIIAGELEQRVPVSSREDEFDRLSANLNQMLDQIQELMDGIRQVSDNIAHDLRIFGHPVIATLGQLWAGSVNLVNGHGVSSFYPGRNFHLIF